MTSETTVNAALPGIRRRLASLLYESLLLLGVLTAVFLVPHLVLGLALDLAVPGPLLLLHVFIVLGVYFLWYWHRSGQTLAMQTWHLRLRSITGDTPTWRQLILRYVLCWPSVLFYGVGFIWAFFDRDRQFLHDRLAGTRIVFSR